MRIVRRTTAALIILSFGLVACADGNDGALTGLDGTAFTGDGFGSDGASLGDGVSADALAGDATGPSGEDTAEPGLTSKPAAFKPYSGGACPTFTQGVNTFTSGGVERRATFFIPSDPKGASVTFLWYGFGDSMANFSGAMGAASMSSEAHMIVVVPEANTPVPAMGINSWGIHFMADPEGDLTLFDDILTCLEQNLDINEKAVYAMGFSAGALWTSVLAVKRSQHLTAATIFSGGDDAAAPGVVTLAYETPLHKLPVLLFHGGGTDSWGAGPLLVNFAAGTKHLAESLIKDEHPVGLCGHGMGHTVPPGGLEAGWHFLRTSYWGEGESQWRGHSGAPFPNYCVFSGTPSE
jgi:poly(3-hydroxybutyrate) depolymerase